MVRKGILVMIVVLCTVSALPGQKKSVADNVDISILDNKATIHFDIKSRKEDKLHRVELKFLDENYNMVTPRSIRGDVGANIPGGTGKTIVWDITQDMELLDSDISPVIFVDGASRQYNNTGGPTNALLSVLMPGLGDYFVADRRMMTFKPAMRTLSTAGLIWLGFYLGGQRYLPGGHYEVTLRGDAWRLPDEEKYFDRYVEDPMHYALFRGDKEVFIALGASIWAADVIWVLARGSNNVKFRKATSGGSTFQLGYVPGGAGFRVSFNF